MNYQSLKGMIESIIKGYKCPGCNGNVTDSNIDIIGAAGTTINIDIECTSCGKHSMIKSEVLSIDINSKNLSTADIEKLKKSLLANKGQVIQNNSIKDNEIVALNNNLKKSKLNVSDLLGDLN